LPVQGTKTTRKVAKFLCYLLFLQLQEYCHEFIKEDEKSIPLLAENEEEDPLEG
jgi:hypothetical protein